MNFIGNIIWLIFGGFLAAMCYFLATISLASTLIGIPLAMQTFKLGVLCLFPFGAEVYYTDNPSGCIAMPMNLIWLICGGLLAVFIHIIFGLLLCITFIGIPLGRQHLRMASLAFSPFGKDVSF